MNYQICSDLHLEFEINRRWIHENPLIPVGDILLIAGDCYHLDKRYAELEFIKKVSDEFEHVYIIPGNHEYYGAYDFSQAGELINEKIYSNVAIINNDSVLIGDTKLIFTTLWSKIEVNVLSVMRGMMDFRKIKVGREKLTVDDYNLVHDKCNRFLEAEIGKSGKKIVITHHLPSPACTVEEYKFSVLNEAFCVDKTNLIENSDIYAWVYGHSHRNKGDFDIMDTKMLTNQLGYVGYNEHLNFCYDKMFS